MGALAHILEEECLPTTHISLIRLHTETIQPPRALWVPYVLGRPFGQPNNPGLQTQIIKAALNMLEAPSGPILEDFEAGDATIQTEETEAWACPVSLNAPAETDDLASVLQAEISQLATWYNEAVQKRGRTTVGTSRLAPEKIGEFLGAFLKGETPDNPRPDVGLPWTVKLATEDLKAYYLEAATAQPGMSFPDEDQLADWFWERTAAGKAYTQLSRVFGKSEDFETKILGSFLMVPAARAAAKK